MSRCHQQHKLPELTCNFVKRTTNKVGVERFKHKSVKLRPEYFVDVLSIARDSRTLAELCAAIGLKFPDRQAGNTKRVGATMAFLAACVLPEALENIPQLFSEFVAWRASSHTKRPQAYLDTAVD